MDAIPMLYPTHSLPAGVGTAQSTRLPGNPFFLDHQANLFPVKSESPRSDAIQTLPSLPAEMAWSMPPGRLSASVKVRNPAPSNNTISPVVSPSHTRPRESATSTETFLPFKLGSMTRRAVCPSRHL